MIYSDSAKYAVLACTELATRRDDRPIQIEQIAASTGISHHYLAKVVQSLVKAGILNSTRGRGGGIQFTCSPSQLSIIKVVKAIDGQHALQDCTFGLGNCDGIQNCPTHPIWDPIRKQIIAFLRDTTIADLASRQQNEFVQEISPRNG
jgi:Rrf2 family iron-sulfur cluster assembly transcriptional regulator